MHAHGMQYRRPVRTTCAHKRTSRASTYAQLLVCLALCLGTVSSTHPSLPLTSRSHSSTKPAAQPSVLTQPVLDLAESLDFLKLVMQLLPSLTDPNVHWSELQHPTAALAAKAAQELYELISGGAHSNRSPDLEVQRAHVAAQLMAQPDLFIGPLGSLVHAVKRLQQDVCGHAAYAVRLNTSSAGASQDTTSASSGRRSLKQGAINKSFGKQYMAGGGHMGASLEGGLLSGGHATHSNRRAAAEEVESNNVRASEDGMDGAGRPSPRDLSQAPNSSFPIVRRITLAVLHVLDLTLIGAGAQPGAASQRGNAGRVLDKVGGEGVGEQNGNSDVRRRAGQQHGGDGGGDLGEMVGLVRGAARPLLASLRALERCSEVLRPVLELLHVSKSGGSSMCELARLSNQRNPHFTPGGNCLIRGVFPDTPRWLSVRPEWVPQECAAHHSFQLLPRHTCSAWLASQEPSCEQRAGYMLSQGFDYYSNEVGLHSSSPGEVTAARACVQHARTAIILRDPLRRAQSHIAHITNALMQTHHRNCARLLAKHGAKLGPWRVPRNLSFWVEHAPAVLDNYVMRHLLGKHGMCRPLATGPQPLVSAFSAEDLGAARAKLLALEHVMTLEGALKEVVMGLGMGWAYTLRHVHYRKASTPNALEADLGFPAGSEVAVKALNTWDAALYRFGRTLEALDATYYASAAVAAGEVVAGAEARDVCGAQALASSELEHLRRRTLVEGGTQVQTRPSSPRLGLWTHVLAVLGPPLQAARCALGLAAEQSSSASISVDASSDGTVVTATTVSMTTTTTTTTNSATTSRKSSMREGPVYGHEGFLTYHSALKHVVTGSAVGQPEPLHVDPALLLFGVGEGLEEGAVFALSPRARQAACGRAQAPNTRG